MVFIGPCGSERDGTARYSASVASELVGRGCNLAVITPRQPERAEWELLGQLGRGFRLRVLEKDLADWSPDIVHVQFSFAAFGTRLLRLLRLLRRCGCGIVVTAHEVTRDLHRAGSLGRLVYRQIAMNATCVVVHTQAARQELLSLCPQANVRVMPHPVLGVPSRQVSPIELRRRFDLLQRDVILMFGFIHPQKGLDELIRAFANARRKCGPSLDRFTIVVAGGVRRRSGLFRIMEVPDHLHRAKVKVLAYVLGIRKDVLFTGYVPDGEVSAWFEMAHTVVLPYRDIEQSGVLSLARSLAVPIITSDAGGLGEDSRNAWKFRARNVDDLSALLSRLEFGRPPSASASDSWELPAFVGATEALYRELCGEKISETSASSETARSSPAARVDDELLEKTGAVLGTTQSSRPRTAKGLSLRKFSVGHKSRLSRGRDNALARAR